MPHPATATPRLTGPATGRVSPTACPASSPASRNTSPSSTFTANRGVQPSSGAAACPSHRPMLQLCSGQATLRPKTMPCESGPPLCGQRSRRAKISPASLRNTATSSPRGRATRRAPSTGMSSTRQIGVHWVIGGPLSGAVGSV